VYPSRLFADPLAEAEQVAVSAVHALGLKDGIAFPQLIVGEDDRAYLIECAARIPGGQMADLATHAVGVDLVEIALRQALGRDVAGRGGGVTGSRPVRPGVVRPVPAHAPRDLSPGWCTQPPPRGERNAEIAARE